ncbi:AlkZ family DNA glycosylase [Dactylosporangium vinaceum]|uniref:Winged helix DNA-binding domain-containing protein n=1 Tax=Dactylosporangium vinaceum TaxID=53362 RepID=A0ABV5MGM0_9ACTN|nr:winged helix DNA-binding domain-containing protein [Dactylosporangium vinaceum]UAB95027.1 AlkZ family DNA glycosylase [Dactylosporangium vinaceum]
MTEKGRRLRSQLLAGAPASDVGSVVERVVGVQAQSWPAARLAVRARSSSLTAADVDAALASGLLARTWLMRGTLHLVAAADLGWLTALFGPINRAAGERRRLDLGVDDAVAARALAEMPAILNGAGPLDRAELIARLARRGVRIDPTGQAPAHLVAFAAAAGVVCRGPDVRGKPTVVLTAEVLASAALAAAAQSSGVPASASRSSGILASASASASRSSAGWSARDFAGDAALAELARRYLIGYGPADAADLAVWSGLPVASARRALALVPTAGSPAASSSIAASSDSASSGGGSSRLLGAFDTLLLGYRDRSFVLAPEHAGLVNRGGGMIAATMLADGRVAGVWQRSGRKVVLQPFGGRGSLSARAREELEAEVTDLSRFLGERLVPAWGEA